MGSRSIQQHKDNQSCVSVAILVQSDSQSIHWAWDGTPHSEPNGVITFLG